MLNDPVDVAVDRALRRVVKVVAIANLAYFGIEFAVASAIGSVSLFADSVDFLEDASLNLLILLGMGWSARNRARLRMLLAIILLMPAAATMLTAWHKLDAPLPPDPAPLSIAALGALVVNAGCALLLARFRRRRGSLAMAAYLSARNDVLANIAIIGAAAVTLWTRNAWPDLIVGVAIAILNADAARTVWQAAREEHRTQP